MLVESNDLLAMLKLIDRIRNVKIWLDQIAEEFIDASEIKLYSSFLHEQPKYSVMVVYEAQELSRLPDLQAEELNITQLKHLTKELVEILVNMSSHSDRLLGCHSLGKLCFVFDSSNINDCKIDLFYLTAVCQDMVVIQ